MVMSDRSISASRFKAECLRLMDEIAASGNGIVVTKRGKPLVRVVAIEPAPSLSGSVTVLVDDDELVAPVDEHWDAVAG
jgi:prevent-host-death family protein